jgi:heme oxygenase
VFEEKDGEGVMMTLRRETQSLHLDTERVFPLMRKDLNLSQYRTILELLSVMHTRVEESIPECPSERLRTFADMRRRTPALDKDREYLSSLGVVSLSVPIVPPPPSLSTELAWIGMLYVSEGSRLGGIYLSGHLEKHFKFSNGMGYSYFSGSGRRTKAEWSDFCSMCEEMVAPADVSRLTLAAKDSFQWHLKCFQTLLQSDGAFTTGVLV